MMDLITFMNTTVQALVTNSVTNMILCPIVSSAKIGTANHVTLALRARLVRPTWLGAEELVPCFETPY